ncbi:hypothetical protein BGM26_01535 [Bacillus sp. FJAT-29790]|uniref:hypothetical protein n=1 Tax=Bacillus sp. FJAT-29790 TaxID=1895002 RepID=UPI001C236459|nr:hypothetical protein [Bacillus sp. FJAT-29790]MBU8877669.1 hypothetical protein [Bacillus sp. FJAT-29790]
MRSLQDALYNWLTIKIVSDERLEDLAAAETEKTFLEMLTEDHGLSNIEIEKDEIMYYVHYDQDGERKKSRFPRELIEVMLDQMNAEPEKFVNYPQE